MRPPQALAALVEYVRTNLSALPRTAEEHAAASRALQGVVGVDGPHPRLLADLAAWFDAKELVAYCVPVAKYAEFLRSPTYGPPKRDTPLACWALKSTADFRLRDDHEREWVVDAGGKAVPAGPCTSLAEWLQLFLQDPSETA